MNHYRVWFAEGMYFDVLARSDEKAKKKARKKLRIIAGETGPVLFYQEGAPGVLFECPEFADLIEDLEAKIEILEENVDAE